MGEIFLQLVLKQHGAVEGLHGLDVLACVCAYKMFVNWVIFIRKIKLVMCLIIV